MQSQHERAKVIYKYALDNIPKQYAQELFKNYTIHEKRYGDRSGIENVIVNKRKFQYEEVILDIPRLFPLSNVTIFVSLF